MRVALVVKTAFVYDLVLVSPSSWKILTDLTVTSQPGILDINVGIKSSLWAAPVGLTAVARETLVKAISRMLPALLLPPGEGELFDRPEERIPGKLPTRGRLTPGLALGPSRLPSPKASPTAPSASPPICYST